ncbi:hypothetical protein BXZ70DRAFT_1004358 [Cristinia sonorae]|uniref:Response regulatory domain-containing protein n=1 Tax=Cristinia sonorae TaxID=1940300 RepID=A0A8K0XU02_9AGAR|nr:hypothetical protein BXZ70DRAFT_1004358 [Cristinia sonorae]
MPDTNLPAVRIPSARPEGRNGDDPVEDAIMVELPPSNKFAISWPANSSTVGNHPLMSERITSLSSSDGETDMSEDEPRALQKRAARADEVVDVDFVTPTSHLNTDEDPMDQTAPPISSQPRLSRAFSMPLPSQLSALQNPRRVSVSGGMSPSSPVEPPLPEMGNFHELSLELADSVQTIIQTLLQLSPPQVLDPAKEQLSACSLSIPMSSISAMFTALKNLNYMSANMANLISQGAESPKGLDSALHCDFDIGETLQTVADSLSGMAAQAGVDLVLFHGDVGMKHVAVKGDECGISYTLTHVLRQVIGVASRGDSVEIGLFIESATEDFDESRSLTPDLDTTWRCIFHIAHRHASVDDEGAMPTRMRPTFGSHILRRLLRHTGASLETDCRPRTLSFVGYACELKLIMDPGDLSAINPTTPASPEAFAGYPEFQIAQEPTLGELAQFAETLKGKKITLHASSSGPFAHHLSSYLTAWGMDVSHVSTEPDAQADLTGFVESVPLPGEQDQFPNAQTATRTHAGPPAFVLIDDDVQVLRNCLLKLKAESAYPLNLNSRKRPSLATNHRPKSSPQVSRVIGPTPAPGASPSVVIVHFTSLSKFKLVKNTIQSTLTPYNGTTAKIPEVIVIPKPAGPRRFLTALHTAVTKPVVDPFFIPIATSPSSPGLHAFSPFFNMTTVPRSPSGRSSGSSKVTSDKSNRSPKEHPAENATVSSSPLGGSDRLEYFSDAAVRLGSSPSTGLVIQSPDGQPAGIFFHPKGRPWSNSPNSDRGERMEGRPRNASFLLPASPDEASPNRANPPRSRARSQLPAPDDETKVKAVANLTASQPSPSPSDDVPSTTGDQSIATTDATTIPGPSRFVSRRSSQASQASSPPSSPQTRGPTATMRRVQRRQGTDGSSPSGAKRSKGPGEGNIVPPISVLIVDDNPIEQTILSTFMKKKKIKYDVAKNGEEAVNKWRTGVFHLILMDIQMPVMDGIQATKEIRRLEKLNGTGVFPATPQSEGHPSPSESSTGNSQSSLTPSYRSSVIIVALTASSLQADRVAALAAGCNDFLTKPVTLEWLNGKIIEWGSIKALQMWADIRPDVVRSISSGQAAQAQNVARRLHVPEGRSTPPGSQARSRSSSQSRKNESTETRTTASTETAPTSPARRPRLVNIMSDDSGGNLTPSGESGNEGPNSTPRPLPTSGDTPHVSIIAPTPKTSSDAATDRSVTDDTVPVDTSDAVSDDVPHASEQEERTEPNQPPAESPDLNSTPPPPH